MKNNINFSLPKFSKKEINIAKDILSSGKINYWTSDSNINFEKNLSKYFNRKYAITVSSGTNALYLAFLSLNLKKDDEIIVPTKTYVSSVSTILLLGAKVRFVDIELESQNINPKQIEKNINLRTKCILAVHLNGTPCNMNEIVKIKKKYNLYLVEDCSQSHGASFMNKKLGSFGDISVFSFCQDKIISTAGEGGCILTNNKKLYNYMWSFSDIGRNPSSRKKISNKKIKKINNNNYKYIYTRAGLNMRMTSLQAEIGNFQLNNLNKNIENRNMLAKIINYKLNHYKNLILPKSNKNFLNAFYRYCIIFKKNKNLLKKIINEINKEFPNIASYGSCPDLRKETVFKDYFKKNNIKKEKLEITNFLYKSILSINISNLNIRNVNKLSNIIMKYI
tara:strand:- start:385 stop:1563 length:1179 start_codon:yes stop_codon:yes gene_type:complete